jgi:DNA-binding SARP family transcriptional activator
VTEVDYRILGPLEAVSAGRQASLGGRVQRAVLGALLLHANQAVSADWLVDAVWGESAPATALHAVSVYVSKLRRELGSDAIVRAPTGYVLRVAPGRLDLERFESLVWQARQELAADEPGRARELLDDALALWRGRALADTQLEDFAQAHVARLEELKLAAVVARAEATLALGLASEVVPELEALMIEHPHDERMAGLLMLALYRAGRQSDALGRYQSTRARLAEELGIDPSESLNDLQRRILARDATLEIEKTDPIRAVVMLPERLDQLERLTELAGTLGRPGSSHEVILAWIQEPGPPDDSSRALAAVSAVLARLRAQLIERGASVRVAAFTATDRAADVIRLARRPEVDLLVLGCAGSALEDGRFAPELSLILAAAPCDVALWFERENAGIPTSGPIVVPFGALDHDWGALELAAWLATNSGRPLVLLGAASGSNGARDASRMLADASLLIQHAAGVVAEPRLVETGRTGLLGAIDETTLLISAVSERWLSEGLGATRLELARSAPCPVMFVRRGQRPGGLSPPESLTLYRWSMTAAAR